VGRTREFDVDAAVTRAMELFWRQGYDATGTRELTAGLGIGQGSLYAAFGSKEGLFVAALDRYAELFAGLVERMRARVAAGEPVKPVAADTMMAMLELKVPDRPAACLLITAAQRGAAADREVGQRVRRALNGMADALTEIITIGRQRGELSTDLPAADLARLLVATYIGTRALRAADPSARAARTTVRTALALVN
jgi:TetR/AcrR family transcriptional repressor of nem operon